MHANESLAAIAVKVQFDLVNMDQRLRSVHLIDSVGDWWTKKGSYYYLPGIQELLDRYHHLQICVSWNLSDAALIYIDMVLNEQEVTIF